MTTTPSGIIDSTKGKIRDKPVSAEALKKMKYAAAIIDPNLSSVVVSSGQDAEGTGTRRTGSTRHEIDQTSHSHATAPEAFAEIVQGMSPAERKTLSQNRRGEWAVTVPGRPQLSFGAAVRAGIVRV